MPRKPTHNTRSNVLQSAEKAVNGSRQTAYSGPEDNFLRIARRWRTYFVNRGIFTQEQANDLITPTTVAQLLIEVKMGRLDFNPSHLDSWVDVAGYAACGAEVAGAK